MTSITAASMDSALDDAKIGRRIIIVSACYSGSWIPALAGDNTIVVTASAKDRTSFGCSDERDLTYFGEAFLTGPLRNGASFKQAFEVAKKKIAGWETSENLTPSKPQAYVGKNMREFWGDR